jgi:APA family basic amino acid/polyamine antiporter
MAKDKLFFRGAEEVHPTFHTPSKSIIIAAIWSSILVLSGSFDQLTDMLVFAAFIFYGAGALGVFVLRHKMKDAPRSFKVNLVIPAIFILFCAVLVVVTLIENPRDAGIGLVLILAGLPFYYFWNKREEQN